MKGVNIYKSDDFDKETYMNKAGIGGLWVLARPEGKRGVFHRIKCAYMAMTGKADLVVWWRQ